MTTIIIFQQDNINYLLTPNLGCGLTLEQIAHKDVPAGVPYKFVSLEDFVLPNKDTIRTMPIDYSNPDGVGAQWGVGTNNMVVAYNQDGSPVVEQGDYAFTPAELEANRPQQ